MVQHVSVCLFVVVFFVCVCEVLQSFCYVTHVMFVFCTVSLGKFFTSEIKCQCCNCLALFLAPSKMCLRLCVSFILYVIVLGFYKIHLFLFDHGTLSVVR